MPLGRPGIDVTEPIIGQWLSMITKGTTLDVVGLSTVEGMCLWHLVRLGRVEE